MRHTDLAPAIFTNDMLIEVLLGHCTAAKGMGREYSMLPDENGWTPDSPFDIETFMNLTDEAVKTAKQHATINKLFYNAEKLQDNVLDLVASAFHRGWDDQRKLMALVDPEGEAAKSAVFADHVLEAGNEPSETEVQAAED